MSEYYVLRRNTIADLTAYFGFLIGFLLSAVYGWPYILVGLETGEIIQGFAWFIGIICGGGILGGVSGLVLGRGFGWLWEQVHRYVRLLRDRRKKRLASGREEVLYDVPASESDASRSMARAVPVTVASARLEDAAEWERMRQELWPSQPGEHAAEIARYLGGRSSEPLECLIARTSTGQAVGFAELSIRPYAEECYSGRVAYLEGWYVDAAWRRRGVGTALVREAEEWGRSQGCTEFASDAELRNTVSHDAHRAAGFTEVNRIVCYRKPL